MFSHSSTAIPLALGQSLARERALSFAVLIGSRANDTARENSDWDIAVMWKPVPDAAEERQRIAAGLAHLAQHEGLRHRLAQCLNVSDEKIDLIDLARASLAMKAVAVEEGHALTVNDERAWAHFQTAVWRALEDHYWERAHAA